MNASEAKELCLRLMRADSEREVTGPLKQAGFWDDPTCWRDLGDEPENYSTVGNQARRSEHALVEKLINAIDEMLIAACRERGIDPESDLAPRSMVAARDEFFGAQLKDLEALSRSITVAATGSRAPGKPCISIADSGAGQTPSSMPSTILSIMKGSKKRIPFVQGKFHMGGTGVLEFCGDEHNVQLVVSKRKPTLVPSHADDSEGDWSFTIVRREDPERGSKSSRFTFLAPDAPGLDGKRGLLHFGAISLPIFPEKNRPYARSSEWGTFFKLYEYDVRAKTNMMLADGLMTRVRLLLPEPALPIRFHECRDFRGDPERSFDTTAVGVIATLDADYRDPKRGNVAWFDTFDLDVGGERFACRMYLFKNKDAADAYRRDEGVIFSYNGQSHAVFSKDFFRRAKVKQDYLWHSMLLFVDCSAISYRAHEKLFMPNRTDLRDSELKRALEEDLQDYVRTHQKLKAIANERRAQERAAQPEVSETFKTFCQEMVNKHPLLARVFGPGFRIRNPHKPVSVSQEEKKWKGKRFPTRFHFRGHAAGFELLRDANVNSQVQIHWKRMLRTNTFSATSSAVPLPFTKLRRGNVSRRRIGNRRICFAVSRNSRLLCLRAQSLALRQPTRRKSVIPVA